MKLTLGADKAIGLLDWLEDNSDQVSKAAAGELYKKPVTVEVKEWKPRHSREQENLYWATLRQYGNDLGYTGKEAEDVLHTAVLCHAFGVKKTIAYAGQVKEVPNQRSSRLSMEDYSYLLTVLNTMMVA